MLHGKGGHSTNECYTLQEQAKRLKTEKDGNSSKKNFSNHSGNKTWSCKAKDGENSTKADLAAFVKKEVKKGVKLCAKKRKGDDSSKDDLNAFDLKDFNSCATTWTILKLTVMMMSASEVKARMKATMQLS